MTKNDKILLIVESPNKVKTISSILKKAGYSKATIVASVGHIMTLGNGGPAFNSGIYPEKDFKMNLNVSEDKKKVVNDIASLVNKAEKVFICTDGDREGEIISWS
jgi:DNA topoisomerase-1